VSAYSQVVGFSALWRGLLAMQLLFCIGVGLVSIVLPDEPER
jgi:hypothetical protein